MHADRKEIGTEVHLPPIILMLELDLFQHLILSGKNITLVEFDFLRGKIEAENGKIDFQNWK